MSKKTTLPDKWLVFPIIGLLTILVIKLISLKEIIANHYFYADLSVHAANLFLLKEYGFHQIVPLWYNGAYKLFEAYPPGWAFFALPGYYIIKDVVAASVLTILLSQVLGLAYLFILGKIQKFSTIKIIAFFALFYANPLMINTVIDIARFPDLFAWTQGLLLLSLVLYYKNKDLDKKFYLLLTAILTALILCHIWVTLLFSFLILGFFLIRKNKERIFIVLSGAAALILSAFWWIPFMKITMGWTEEFGYGFELMSKGSLISFNTLILAGFFLIFYYYYKSENKSKTELKFYAPLLVLGALVLTRLILFIPVLNRIPVNEYNYLFLLFAILLLFNIRFVKFSRIARIAVIAFLIILPVASIGITFFHFEMPEDYTQKEKDMISLLPHISEKYILLGDLERMSEGYPVITYATTEYKLTSVCGSYYHGAPDVKKQIFRADHALMENRCEDLESELDLVDVDIILTHGEFCETLEGCGFNEEIEADNACIYSR